MSSLSSSFIADFARLSLYKEQKKLTDLPSELLEMVAERVDPNDLPSFRRSSKLCEKASFRPFSASFFVERQVLLASIKSLKNFLEIGRHPIFGPMLRKLTIFIDEWRPEALAAARTKEIEARNLDMQHLTEVFKRLGELDMNVKIGIASGAAKHFSRRVLLPLDQVLPPKSTHVSGFMTVMDALMHANYKPRDFSFTSGSSFLGSWHLPVHRLVSNGSLGLCHEVLTFVKSLTLDVWIKEEKTELAVQFFEVVSSCGNLETLTVYARDKDIVAIENLEPCCFSIGEGLLCQDFPRLKSLKLWDALIDPNDLVSFLRRHRNKYHLGRFDLTGLQIIWEEFEKREGNEVEDGDVLDDILSRKNLAKLTGLAVGCCIDD